jgi:hypothetical protein
MENGQTQEITELVKRFEGHQRALGLSDGRFAARYDRYLGSHKTWKKLKDGDWEGHVHADRILLKLRKFAGDLDGARSFDEEQFLDSLPYVVQMNAQFERLLASPLDIRMLISLAPQGVGKSWWASSILKSEDKTPYFYCRMLHNWREKSWQQACAFSDVLGAGRTRNPGDQVAELIKHIQAMGEIVLLVDEAHNGGIILFKLLKDLIDETSMRVVYLGFPTEFDVIVGRTSSTIGESRQTLRRALQPIHDDYREGVAADDVEVYLAGQGFKRTKELGKVADEITPLIAARYNLTTLATALRDARKQAEDEDVDLSLGLVTEAVRALCSTAAERRAARLAAREGK